MNRSGGRCRAQDPGPTLVGAGLRIVCSSSSRNGLGHWILVQFQQGVSLECGDLSPLWPKRRRVGALQIQIAPVLAIGLLL